MLSLQCICRMRASSACIRREMNYLFFSRSSYIKFQPTLSPRFFSLLPSCSAARRLFQRFVVVFPFLAFLLLFVFKLHRQIKTILRTPKKYKKTTSTLKLSRSQKLSLSSSISSSVSVSASEGAVSISDLFLEGAGAFLEEASGLPATGGPFPFLTV